MLGPRRESLNVGFANENESNICLPGSSIDVRNILAFLDWMILTFNSINEMGLHNKVLVRGAIKFSIMSTELLAIFLRELLFIEGPLSVFLFAPPIAVLFVL